MVKVWDGGDSDESGVWGERFEKVKFGLVVFGHIGGESERNVSF